MLNSAEHENLLLINSKIAKISRIFRVTSQGQPFILLINVGILTFMSRINFILSRVDHEKSFITSGPDPGQEAVLTCTNNPCFEQKKKNIKFFHLKISIFTAFKNLSILPRRVIVMWKKHKALTSVNLWS